MTRSCLKKEKKKNTEKKSYTQQEFVCELSQGHYR
jgi:hypothetical protein